MKSTAYLLGRLVEHLALHGESLRAINEIVQFLSALQDGFHSLVLLGLSQNSSDP